MVNEPETNNKKIFLKQKALSTDEIRVFNSLTKTINSCKKNLIKSPIENSEKLNSLLGSNEEKLIEISKMMNNINSWWMKEFVEYLSTPRATQVATQ